MAELRLLSFAALILLVLYVEWHAIVSPRLLRLYFRRYSLRMLMFLTVVSAAFFATLSQSKTPTSDGAVFLVVLITSVLGVCLAGFAYCDLFGPRIDRRLKSKLRTESERKSEPCPKVRTKGRDHQPVMRVDEIPLIDVEVDQPSET